MLSILFKGRYERAYVDAEIEKTVNFMKRSNDCKNDVNKSQQTMIDLLA